MVSNSENRIKRLRLHAGILTIREAAELLKVSPSYLYKVEEGYVDPGIRLAARMAKVYKCTISEIMTK